MATIESGATIRNGVDTAKLFATLDAVRAQPAAAQFTFRVANRWISGTHSENRISGFFGVGVEQDRGREFIIETDHPEVLVGNDNGPTPAEMLLGALASCLTRVSATSPRPARCPSRTSSRSSRATST